MNNPPWGWTHHYAPHKRVLREASIVVSCLNSCHRQKQKQSIVYSLLKTENIFIKTGIKPIGVFPNDEVAWSHRKNKHTSLLQHATRNEWKRQTYPKYFFNYYVGRNVSNDAHGCIYFQRSFVFAETGWVKFTQPFYLPRKLWYF